MQPTRSSPWQRGMEVMPPPWSPSCLASSSPGLESMGQSCSSIDGSLPQPPEPGRNGMKQTPTSPEQHWRRTRRAMLLRVIDPDDPLELPDLPPTMIQIPRRRRNRHPVLVASLLGIVLIVCLYFLLATHSAPGVGIARR